MNSIFIFYFKIKILEATNYGKCDPVEKYEKLALLGSGTYGSVYSARNKDTNEICALKQIKFYNEADVLLKI